MAAPVLLTLFAESLLTFTHGVADQVFDPRGYMTAVLGEARLSAPIHLPGDAP